MGSPIKSFTTKRLDILKPLEPKIDPSIGPPIKRMLLRRFESDPDEEYNGSSPDVEK